MKLVGYTRVSTAGQVTDGEGLDTQRDTIARWAKTNGHRVREWHEDAGESGSNGIETRAGLADALAAVKTLDGIVVADLDRLARSLSLQELILDDLARQDKHLFSCSGADDLANPDPERVMIRQILGAVAQYERAKIRGRMLAGQRRKHAAGGYAYGGPPYGWKAQDRELVPVPHEQDVISMMRALRASGSSYRDICATLTASGAPARRGSWAPDTVRKILRRPTVKVSRPGPGLAR